MRLSPHPPPIRIAEGWRGIAERERSTYRYGLEEVEKCDKVCEFLMQAVQVPPVENSMHAAGSVEGELRAAMEWYMPTGDAERDHVNK